MSALGRKPRFHGSCRKIMSEACAFGTRPSWYQICVPILPEAGSTEALALARRDVRDGPADAREGRRAYRGAEGQDQARPPGQLPVRGHVGRRDRHHHDARSLIGAAVAAGAPPDNPDRVPNVAETTAVNPAATSRQTGRSIALTNKRGQAVDSMDRKTMRMDASWMKAKKLAPSCTKMPLSHQWQPFIPKRIPTQASPRSNRDRSRR